MRRSTLSGMGPAAEHMRAAVVLGAGRIEVQEVPVPVVDADDVLVAVDLCGICGSDLHMVLDGWGRPGSSPGHEWTGTVATVGSAVTRWRPGDLVIGGPPLACGHCAACDGGRPSLCGRRSDPGGGAERGAFATYKLTSADDLLALPDGLDARSAALAEPLAVALHALTQARAEAGQRALVMGAGPIGALAIAALRAQGLDDVTCAEPSACRRELAARVGATSIVHPDDLVVPSIAEPGFVVDSAVDLVLECSGNRVAMEAGLGQLVRGGVLVLVGAGLEPPRFDPNRILLNELSVTGAFLYDDDGFERALDLLAPGRLPVEDLLEPGEVSLDGLMDAMVDLAKGRRAGKVLVRP